MKAQDTYKEPIIIHTKGAIIRVFRPELSPEEREIRMKEIYRAAQSLLRSMQKVGD